MHFQKQDLVHKHYSWTNGEHVFKGQPSRRSFDRNNGDQVLFLINFYASLSDRFTLREGKLIEQKIHSDVPEDAKSELSVFNWLRWHLFISE
ncbi:hypothetical protein [Niabella drilacis]|uniref:Uncharacterized protein n=1 Tax=Niabella drilacis (strain DSM 25811 / CCM 8410 / CCUG 62505 / LMG 26954 / E90) TaxID=1285928 RepID=A0A1G6PL94_NIADE|nr:hypothetical protein [Niabella drilacis]SDC80296.1 hypothetical protein SAMN04487894_10460 [Niabella drilacis]